jgi:hypothetical protein
MNQLSKIIRLIDRTRTVADWKCPRARYWGYEYKGRGITRGGLNLDLFIGIIVHDALAALASYALDGQTVPIDEVAQLAVTQLSDGLMEQAGGVIDPDTQEFILEQTSLIEGMIRGFYKHTWPILMSQYTIVCAEQDMDYRLGNDGSVDYIFMTKPDLIVEDKEGNLVYIEYKTTSSKKENWVNSWDTAVQLHSSIKATARSLDREVGYVQIVGLYKGWESYGKQSSPFCYAYKKSGNPPFTQEQISYTYKAGYRRTATWEMQGGVKQWVDEMPENVLADQYPMTPPIPVNDDLIEAFFRQRLLREKEIAIAVNIGEYDDPVTGIDKVFPQRFDQCAPSFGYGCQFKKLCFGEVKDPLTEGYVLREPHHDQERIQLGLD